MENANERRMTGVASSGALENAGEDQVPQLVEILARSSDEDASQILRQLAKNLNLMLNLVNHAEVAYAKALQANGKELERLHKACADVRECIKLMINVKREMTDELALELVRLMRQTLHIDSQASADAQAFQERLYKSRRMESGLKLVGTVLLLGFQARIMLSGGGSAPSLKS